MINFGANVSDWLIKFGALVTFCVLIDYFDIMYSPEIGATTFSFPYFLFLMDDS